MTLRVAAQQFVSIAQVRAFDDCACIGANSPVDAAVGLFIDQASDMIATVSGMRNAGRQALIARPCRDIDLGCVMSCPCCDLDAIPLGDERPTVTSVKVDGVELNSSLYWLHWNRVQWMLARRPDTAAGETSPPSWPTWQDRWRLPSDTTNTFAIYFTQGIHVDSHIITAAALEIICDLAADDLVRANAVEGAVSIQAGGASVVLDRNLQRDSDDTRLKRIANGELGPFTRRMMGIISPSGRSYSMVFSPELLHGWNVWLEIDPAP